jgi:hypothetical protein
VSAAEWSVELESPAGVGTEDLLVRVANAMTEAVEGEPEVALQERAIIARLRVDADNAERALEVASLAFRHVLVEAGVPSELACVDRASVERAGD